MIKGMSHVTILVNNQDEALAFYTEKVGFSVRTDMTMEGFRWLTVGPETQPDVEFVLMEPTVSPMMDEETVNQLRALMSKGALGAGVFTTDNCQATYEELKSRGVEFLAPPQERPYGVEAIMKDNSGNWFSLTEQRYQTPPA